MSVPWRHSLLTGLLLVIVVLAALPVLAYPMGRDQGMYANIGATILRGGLPYRDMWDIKPPPIYYLYATGMALFGQTPVGVRALDLVCVPLGMIGLALIGTRLGSVRVGRWGALLYGVFYLSDQFANLTQSDSLVTVPMIYAALACVLAGHAAAGSRRALGWAFVCGMVCGLVLWFKQYQAFFVVALVLWQLGMRRPSGLRRVLPEAVAFAVGGLLTGGGLLVAFAASGMLDELLVVAQSTSAYNAQYSDWGAFFAQIGSYFTFRFAYWGVLFGLAALGLLVTLWSRLVRRAATDRPDQYRGRGALLLLWLIAATAFMVIQRLGFDTHWYPMLPPLALLGGIALDALISQVHRPRGQQALTALLIVGLVGVLAYNTWRPFLPYASGQETQGAYFARFQANDLKPAESLDVVEWLRPRLVSGDTLYVWGFRPEVAFMGGWRPPTRWQAQFPLVASWYPHEWQQQNVDILWAAMPPYALILRDDYMPWVTGRDADSYTILQDYTELNNWFIANYDIIETRGDFILCQRKPR